MRERGKALNSETERPSIQTPLRQGDIIKLEGDKQGPTASDLGVIINADCDLAHNKTDGVIAYLPIYRFKSYLENFWAGDHVDDLREALFKQVQRICALEDGDKDNLERWIVISDPNEISEKLSSNHNLKPNQKQQLSDAVKRLRLCLDPKHRPFDTFLEFCRCESDPIKHARKQVANAKKAIGEGHFFVSEIVGEPDVGFVIRMRRIYTIDAASCFTSIPALQTSSIASAQTAYRLAALTPIYRYRVAQLFAQQFSRIGLPDEMTALSDLAIDDIISPLAR